MNAPDYTRTVLGAVEGLRENYLKKLQLEQQRQQAQANLNLGYAQLAAQQENARMNRDLQNDKMQLDFLQEANRVKQVQDKLQADAQEQKYNVYKDMLSRDLDERRFQLQTDEKTRSAQKEASEALAKRQASERLAEFAKLAANKDYEGMQKWYADAQKDTVDTLDYGAMINQASQIAAGIEKSNNLNMVNVMKPEIDSFTRDAGNLTATLSNFSPQDREAKIAGIKTRGLELLTSIKDPDVRDTLKGVLGAIDTRNKEIEKEKSREQEEFFIQAGNDNRLAELSSNIQSKFDDLYASTSAEERGTQDFMQKQRRLMLEYNKLKSENEAKRYAEEMAAYEMAQMANPNYTITNEDGSVSPKFPAPNISNLSFSNGLLDRDNNLSASVQNEIEKFRQQMRTSGVAKPPENQLADIANLVQVARGGKPITKPGEPEPAKTTQKQMRFSNVALLPTPTTGQLVSGPQAEPQPTTPQPEGAPQTNTQDYRANAALLEEIDRQIKAGNKMYLANGKPTNINLASLRNRVVSRMGQRIVSTFGTPGKNMIQQALTPSELPEATE